MSKMRRVLPLFDTSGAASRRTLRGIAKYSILHGPWVFFREPPFYIASTFGHTKITRKLPDTKTSDVDGVIAHIPHTKRWQGDSRNEASLRDVKPPEQMLRICGVLLPR